MQIKIHRLPEYAGTLVEVSAGKTKILLDGGVTLEENGVLSLAELTAREPFPTVDAVFLSHYRTDYAALMRGLPAVPVYTGKLAGRIAAASGTYKAKKLPDFAGYYASGASLVVGDLKITPYLVDEPLYDGYLLLIEGDGKSVLYTGEYHANGRKSFEDMVKHLPARVDLLLCEGGVLTREDTSLITERDLEEQAYKLMSEKTGPVFVLQAPNDFDRAATLYHAAKRNKRIFLEDLYMAQLANAAGKAMPNPTGWDSVKAYLTTGYKEDHFRYQMFAAQPRVAKAELGSQKFVLCIRTTMKKYMKTLSQCIRFKDGLILNALPPETQNSITTQEFLAFAESKGLTAATLRPSNHADAKALKTLIETVHPARIAPLKPRDAGWLKNEYPQIPIETKEEVCI